MSIYSKNLRIAIKNKLYLQQNGECLYCDKKFPINQLTIEHIIPGSSLSNNMDYSLACEECNKLKGNIYLMNSYYGYKKMTEDFLHKILILQLYYSRKKLEILQEILI